MKKILFICGLSFVMPFAGYAQQVAEGNVQLGKTDMKGFIATCKYPANKVQGVVEAKLKNAGIDKVKKRKKFYSYKGILLPDISPNRIDLYYKVQKKKHRSKLYFVVSKGYDNYISSGSDATATANINNFLTGIDATIAHNDEVAKKEQEIAEMDNKVDKEKEDVKKAEEEKNKKEQQLKDIQNSKN